MPAKQALVHYRDTTDPLDCPYGHVQRIVTAGEGGIANVHVVTAMEGTPHIHEAYDEVYYVLSGSGMITIGEHEWPLRPGAVAVIPAGEVHGLVSDSEFPLEFIIFGTPPLPLRDVRAKPQKPKI